ncbi:hypothetical protein Tco_0752937 [Tanacetum coccineum]
MSSSNAKVQMIRRRSSLMLSKFKQIGTCEIKDQRMEKSNEEDNKMKKNKVVRKNDDALIIEEWVLDDEEEDTSQPKIEKKTGRPSIAKKEFVKTKQQEKTAMKTVKQVEHHRQNTHSPRSNQRN